MVVEALIGQFPISIKVGENLDAIREILTHAFPDDLVVLPEGALSGYEEDPAFLSEIAPARVQEGLRILGEEAEKRGLHLFFGSCLLEEGRWYNAGLYFGPNGEQFVYRKVNLANKERGHFAAGSELPVLEISVQGRTVKVGVQLCREIRYPEQWRHLAGAGAEVFVYLNNAVGDESLLPVWRSHLVSRAAENQRFVLGANNARPKQKCPTLAVDPDGSVLWEATSDAVTVGRVEIDLSLVQRGYLDQARTDVVECVYRQA